MEQHERGIATKGHLPPRMRIFSVIAIVVILGISFVSYFVFQANYESQIRSTMFEQYKGQQIQYARLVEHNIESDLDSLMNRLQIFAESRPIQDRRFTGILADNLLKDTYIDVLQIGNIDGVSILDKNNVIVNYYDNKTRQSNLVSNDTSTLSPIIEYTNNSHKPTLTTAYRSLEDGTLRIALLYPINDHETNEYVGAVMMPIVVNSFFKDYGNLDDVTSPYIAVLDRNATWLTSPLKDFIGKNFFDPSISSGIGQEAMNHYKKVLSGQEVTSTFTFLDLGYRINTGIPVNWKSQHPYFVFVITPTALIYSQIDSLITSQKTIFYLLQSAIAGAIGISLFFLVRWSKILESTVQQKTSDLRMTNEALADTTLQLQEANSNLRSTNERLETAIAQLQAANEQLQVHDKMQKEFINIAAHELRTPIMPILISMHLAKKVEIANGESQVLLDGESAEMIERNAKRLEKLANDILTVTKIEGNRIELNLESVDINEKIMSIISDAKTFVPAEKNIHFVFIRSKEPVVVEADSSKLSEVIFNLAKNAIRFIGEDELEGKITFTTSKDHDKNEALVSIRDNGKGISAEIIPRLFTKFASSEGLGGTGLGLYISKAIIDAHGGKIWAENNRDGIGATFTFTLPLKE